jgi:hypothetical protein
MFVQQFAHGIHALPPPPDHAALPACGTPLCAFRLTSLVDERRIERAYPRGDYFAVFSARLSGFNDTPADGCNSKVNPKDAFAHHAT